MNPAHKSSGPTEPAAGHGAREPDRSLAGGFIARVGQWIETAFLVGILVVMIGLASAQVLLRGSAGASLVWADEALRLLVLWATMIGAVAACRDHVHLRIDFLSRFLKPRGRRVADFVTNLFTAGVSAILAWQSMRFVSGSHEFGDQILGSWPAWPVQAVLPVCFALIAWRYFRDCWRGFFSATQPADEPPP